MAMKASAPSVYCGPSTPFASPNMKWYVRLLTRPCTCSNDVPRFPIQSAFSR